MDLRPYQLSALEQIAQAFRDGQRRVLLCAPTGAGKSLILAAATARSAERRRRVLWVAHRRELIDQAAHHLEAVGVTVGRIQPGVRVDPSRAVQVASIQTLARRALPAADLLIIDEAHRTAAESYAKVIAALPDAHVLGVTATPVRTDGRGLAGFYDALVVVTTPAELVAQGWLVPVVGYAYLSPNLQGVRTVRGDFDERALDLRMREPHVVGNVVDRWLTHAGGARSVVFAVSVQHSRDLEAAFQAAGVTAEHLDGETPLAQRADILARLRSGTTRVLCNVGIVTEGFDLPELEVCVLARPTQSLGLYLQMVGRVRRPALGKTHGRIHDHSGNVMRHGLPDDAREWVLTNERQERESVPSLRQCAACFAVYPPTPRCPVCGHAPLSVVRELRTEAAVAEVEISEMPISDRRNYKASYLRMLVSAREAGYRDGYAAQRFKGAFGHWPPASWRNDCPVAAPSSLWTYERCRNSARQYATRSAWQEGDAAAYNAAKRSGWFEACVRDMPVPVRHTREGCLAAARRFRTPTQWSQEDNRTFVAAIRNGWYADCLAAIGGGGK